jgi:hypothetical protein
MRSTLSSDIDELRTALPGYFKELAEYSSEVVQEEVVKRTPPGEVLDQETGRYLGPSNKLKKSVRRIKPRLVERDTWIAGAETDSPIAGYVEKGTRAHPIPLPGTRKVLRFWKPKGIELVYTHLVKHPGTRGKFMFARGLMAAVPRILAEGQGRLDVLFQVTTRR